MDPLKPDSYLKNKLKELLQKIDEPVEKFKWNIFFIFIFTIINYCVFVYHENRKDFTIFTSFYFTVITNFTIGYGDYSPKSGLGQWISIIHIMIVWLINLVPPQI